MGNYAGHSVIEQAIGASQPNNTSVSRLVFLKPKQQNDAVKFRPPVVQ